MDIKHLLKKSLINWPGSEEDLRKDFEDIVQLLSSLPEPECQEVQYKRFAPLFDDVENKEAKKEDIVKEDMFKI